MNDHDLFNAGTTAGIVPEGDTARQAVDSLRGYAYQVLAATLAWLDIGENSRLFLEVAEDFATVAKQALDAVQVKDTERSRSVTLNSKDIRDAVATFVDLVAQNPDYQVELRFLTTSDIGTEQKIADRPAGMAGLEYWRKVANCADPQPLRTILESDKFPASVREFSKARNNKDFRHEFIQKIRWECGKPNYPALRRELEDRLVVVARDRFYLPSPEARRLAEPLMYRVLNKCTANAPQDRVLTRADLYSAIDALTRVSVPRSVAESFLRIPQGLMESIGEGLSSGGSLSLHESDLLIDGTMLPPTKGLIQRIALENAVANILKDFGAGVLTGSSGLGKSNVTRAAAIAHFGAFHLVEFRNLATNETRHMLDMVFARMGGLPSSALILDDLNNIDDNHVTLSLSRVIEASRRHNLALIITCHRRPSTSTLAGIGLNQGCVVECPYFSEKEVCSLVTKNGGNPNRWGKLAYIAGAAGHPQLTHAFVIGMAARGWPVGEFRNMVNRGMSSEDIDETRDEVRRGLVSQLPEETRNLLYRLSLSIGRFNRSLVLKLGDVPPTLAQTGECMDQLIGPWIEPVGRGTFRVSPLASAVGRQMLPSDVQQRIHETIAVQMLRKSTVDVRDVDAILAHAILGKSPQSLFALAQGLFSADPRTVDILAEQFLFLRFSRTDVAIFAEDPLISGILRLAQFKLAAAAGEGDEIATIAAAFFKEISGMPSGEQKCALEAMAAVIVLGTKGIANQLDNWITLLLHFKTVGESNAFLQDMIADALTELDGSNYLDALFDIGSAGLTSIARLEHIIKELDKLNESERTLLLTQMDGTLYDCSVLINGTWAAQTNRDDFDASDATIRYQQMARMTRNWGIHTFSLQCSVAQAVILDEYENKKDCAVAVLNEAATTLGDDVILRSALANIHWRHHENQAAFETYRSLVDHVGGTDPAERAFLLRKAAINAAKCDEWTIAATWFLNAQNAANLAQDDTMDVIAIGLGADSAVASLKAGNVGRALMRLANALTALADVDPEATLQATYCHLVIHHTVLWTQTHIERNETNIVGPPIGMEAGSCSNPDPSPAIREHPLAHIDIAWYMLARAETVAGVDAGITDNLDLLLRNGSIPSMETVLRTQKIQADIDTLDAERFTSHFMPYVESAVCFSRDSGGLHEPLDPVAPKRGQVPPIDEDGPFDGVAERVAKYAIIVFGIRSAMEDQPDAMRKLESCLEDRFRGPFPGKPVFDYWSERTQSIGQLDNVVLDIIKSFLRNLHVEPKAFWMAGLRFFEWLDESMFKGVMTTRLAAWQRSGWKRILATELFRLARPQQTVPPIEKVLAMPEDNRGFVAKLLVATSETVGSPLGSAYRRRLETIATDEETHSK